MRYRRYNPPSVMLSDGLQPKDATNPLKVSPPAESADSGASAQTAIGSEAITAKDVATPANTRHVNYFALLK